jgi:hypothetical protein
MSTQTYGNPTGSQSPLSSPFTDTPVMSGRSGKGTNPNGRLSIKNAYRIFLPVIVTCVLIASIIFGAGMSYLKNNASVLKNDRHEIIEKQ